MQKGNTRITAIKSGGSSLDDAAATRLEAKRQQRLERSAAQAQARAKRKGLATVTKFDPDEGYEVRQGNDTYSGRQSISNGAIGVGDRVTHKGKLIDAMRRPAPQPTIEPTPTVGVEPIKYLYSVVVDDKHKFYVGGHQRQPVEVFSLPSTALVWVASIDNLGKDKYAIDIAYDDKTVRYVGKTKKWSVDTPLNADAGYALYVPRGYGFWQTGLQGGLTNFEDPTISEAQFDGNTATNYARADFIYNGQYVKGDQYISSILTTTGSINSTTEAGTATQQDYVFPGQLKTITTVSSSKTTTTGPGASVTGSESNSQFLYFTAPFYKMHPKLEVAFGVLRNFTASYGSNAVNGTDQLISLAATGGQLTYGSESNSNSSSIVPLNTSYLKLFSGVLNQEIVRQILGRPDNYQVMMVSTEFDKTVQYLFLQHYTESQSFDYSFRLLNFETNNSVNKNVKIYPPSLAEQPIPTFWDYSYAP